uniref:Uncharacterized protein n=1 Tax=Toxoplasma gondii COUG TaxID=1074873 RepID=A0A2G8Y7B3_TOXGO|nr:hypothetical protein TGCOUG_232420 [Toxoplasma gondii COUG]
MEGCVAAPTVITRVYNNPGEVVTAGSIGSVEKAEGNSSRSLTDVTSHSGPDSRTRQGRISVFMNQTNPNSAETIPGADTSELTETHTPELFGNKEKGHPASNKNDTFWQVNDVIENILLEEAQSVRLSNDWRLIEDSWRMVELFQSQPSEYLSSGFHLKLDETGRLIATTRLPFWKVDLAGTMRSFATVAMRQQLGLNLPRSRPFRINAGKGVIEIGYSPFPQRAAVSVGYRDTKVTVSAGKPQMIRIPVNNTKTRFDTVPIGGKNISVDVKSNTTKIKTIYDADEKVYGQQVALGDTNVSVLHGFEGNASAPTNVTVSYQDSGISLEFDPLQTEYGMSLMVPKGRFEASLDSDARRNHLRGQLDEFTVLWENDLKDAQSQAVSARVEVENAKAGTSVSAGADRNDNREVGGNAGFKAKDMDIGLGFQDDRLEGSVTLGTIKYKIQLRDGLPDFILVS